MSRSNGMGGGPPRPYSTEAIWERVQQQGSALQALAEETSSQFRDFRAEVGQQLTGLSNNLSQQVQGSLAAIEKLANKIDANQTATNERSRPQYFALFGAMVAALGLSVTITQVLTGLHDKPVDDKLSTVTQAIADLTKNVATSFGDVARNTVSQQQFTMATDYRDKIQAALTAGRDQVRMQMQKEIEQLDAENKHTAENQVPRKEHEFHWTQQEKTNEGMRMAIEAINRRLDLLSPAGDYLKSLSERQHELELKVYGDKR